MLEFAEEPLDEIALAIQGEVGLARGSPVGLGRDDGNDVACFERRDQGIAVVAFVGEEGFGRDLVEQRFGLGDVGGLTRRQRQRNRVAERIDNSVDLGRQPAARSADGLIFAVFFWAPALC